MSTSTILIIIVLTSLSTFLIVLLNRSMLAENLSTADLQLEHRAVLQPPPPPRTKTPTPDRDAESIYTADNNTTTNTTANNTTTTNLEDFSEENLDDLFDSISIDEMLNKVQDLNNTKLF